MTIYDKARLKITNDTSLNDIAKEWEFLQIDHLEEGSAKSIKRRTKNTCKLKWKLASDCSRSVLIGITIYMGILLLVSFGSILPRLDERTALESCFSFIRLASELGFWCFAFVAVTTILDILSSVIKCKAENKRFKDVKVSLLLCMIFLILSVPHLPSVFSYEVEQIGHFYEPAEHKGNYVVYMSKEPQSKRNRQVYTLPAEIERIEDYDGSITHRNNLTGEETDYEITSLNYHINYLWFRNGGYLYFMESDNSVVIPDKEVKLKDSHDDTYYITLTKEKYDQPLTPSKKERLKD